MVMVAAVITQYSRNPRIFLDNEPTFTISPFVVEFAFTLGVKLDIWLETAGTSSRADIAKLALKLR
jgi:hypothetical protein